MPRWITDLPTTLGPSFAADSIAKATLLLFLAALFTMALRNSAAAVRHRVWSLVLTGVLITPLLSWSLPGWQIPILQQVAISPTAEPMTPPPSAADNSAQSRPKSTAPQSLTAATIAPSPNHQWPSTSTILWTLWTLGSSSSAVTTLIAIARNEQRRRHSEPVVNPAWRQLLDTLTQQLSLNRTIDLRTNPNPIIPITWGLFRPVILLPEQSNNWPDATRRLVLLHELAHIKRRDVPLQLIGRLATAIYWFHPLAWYALHRLRADCECACDDHVVHTGVPRTDYAQQLVDLARTLRPTALATALPLVRKTTLEQRITTLFDDNRNHQPLTKSVSTFLSLSSLILLTALALIHLDPTAAAQPPVAPPSTSITAPKRFDSLAHEVYTHPITITGQALDPAGKPLPNARIYIASSLADCKRIAETTTDDQGRYQLVQIPLPIQRANSNTARDQGAFEVFGLADGFGFDWHQQVWFYPTPKPPDFSDRLKNAGQRGNFAAKDKFVLNFEFPPAAQISGTIVDELGKPRPNVRLKIRECRSLKFIHNVFGVSFFSLYDKSIVPDSIKDRLTDPNGRFQFTGLPPDCRFRIEVRGDNIPPQEFTAATADHVKKHKYDQSLVLTGEIKLVCATPVSVPFKLIFADTNAPAAGVRAGVANKSIGVNQTTDEQGRANFKLPPGNYVIAFFPADGTPYLVTESKLSVTNKPPAEPIVFGLNPAAIVEITVINAKTGAPVPNIYVWDQPKPDAPRDSLTFRSWQVSSGTTSPESPRSDPRGKLRVLVPPGIHRIGVGLNMLPVSSEVVESNGQEVDAQPGKPAQLTFHIRDV